MVCSSRPLIMASGSDGTSEYELAAVYYQILNRRAADGAAYITVRVSATWQAHCDGLSGCDTPEAEVRSSRCNWRASLHSS